LVAGVSGAIAAVRRFHIRVSKPAWSEICDAIREGWSLFVSKAATTLYVSANVPLLGLLCGPTVVGYFSAAEKVIRAAISLLYPLSQAVYPRVTKLAADEPGNALQWSRRVIAVMAVVGAAMTGTLMFGAGLIIRLVGGMKFLPAIPVLQILSVVPFCVAISTVLGPLVMIPFGKDRAFMAILGLAGAANLLMSLIFAPLWKAPGMALAVALSEVLVSLAMLLYLSRVGLNPLMRPKPLKAAVGLEGD
jgi:PST family polysaccharide transporter